MANSDIKKESKNGVTVVHLCGVIGERVNFDQSIGDPGKEIHVYAKDIARITSFGVKIKAPSSIDEDMDDYFLFLQSR